MTASTAANAVTASPCTATINGINANVASTPETAIHVQEHSTLTLLGTNEQLPLGSELEYRIQMQFYLLGSKIAWTVDQGSRTSKVFTGTVNVDKYAKYSTGLYLVHAYSFGSEGRGVCATDAFIDVVSGNMSDLETAGLALGGIGVLALVGAGVSATREGRKLSDPQELADEAQKAADEMAAGVAEASTHSPMSCGFWAFMALALTARAIASNTFHTIVHHVRSH
jgi:hypothetical protein